MDSHWVEVFNRANDDAVIRVVAHNFHFVFFPTEEALFNEDLGGWGKIETARNDCFKFFLVVSDPTTGSTEGERRTNDKRHHPDLFRDLLRLLHRVRHSRDGEVKADLNHRVFETLTIFALIDGVSIGADHADPILIEGSGIEKLDGDVQRSLTSEGRQERIGPFFDDDSLNRLRSDRLDIGPLRKLRVGHNRCRIGIHENDLVTFLAQRLASLGPGVIKLTTLSNDDGAGSDHEDFFDASVLRHRVCLKLRLSDKTARFCKAPSDFLANPSLSLSESPGFP